MIAGLLLATGDARRFEAGRLMRPLRDGTPFAVASQRTLRTAADAVVALVDRGTPAAAHLAAEGTHLVTIDRPGDGISHAVARGMEILMAMDPPFRGCIIAMADMALVRAATIARLAVALRAGASIAAPAYRGTRGLPLGFGAGWFPRLAALTGDTGMGDLLAVHRRKVARIPVDDPGILADADWPPDPEAALTDP